jgi:hypothetical protein
MALHNSGQGRQDIRSSNKMCRRDAKWLPMAELRVDRDRHGTRTCPKPAAMSARYGVASEQPDCTGRVAFVGTLCAI